MSENIYLELCYLQYKQSLTAFLPYYDVIIRILFSLFPNGLG